jgi:O-antigen/teichoic acid export membrane protein
MLKLLNRPRFLGGGVTLVQAIMQFMLLSSIALNFDVSSLGEFNFINAIILPSFMFFSFGFRNLLVVNYGVFSFGSTYFFRLVVFFLLYILLSVLVYFLNLDFYLFSLLFLFKFFEMMSELNWVVLQAEGKHPKLFFYQVSRWIFCTGVFILFSFLGHDMHETALYYLLSAVFVYFFLELPQTAKNWSFSGVNFFLGGKEIFQYLKFSSSLFLSSMQQNGIRILVGLILGNVVLGVFSVAYQLYNMSFMIYMNSINFLLKKDGRGLLKENFKFSVFVFILLVALWYLFGNWFLGVFFGVGFLDIYPLMFYLFVSLFFRMIAYNYQFSLMQGGNVNLIFNLNLIVTLFSLLGSYFLMYIDFSYAAYLSVSLSALVYFLVFVGAKYVHK